MWELIKYEPTNNNGDIYDAIRKLEREIRKTGGSAVAHHKLGSLYLKNNDLQDAIKHFEKSKEYDSTFLRAYLDLIFCLCMLKKYDKV